MLKVQHDFVKEGGQGEGGIEFNHVEYYEQCVNIKLKLESQAFNSQILN